jgi:large subunit ribosomal protein L13
MIINAENLILGRFVTVVAKKAILGEKVDIVNCEKAVITGNRQEIITKYKDRVARGAMFHGPYFPRRADRVVKRTVRGMLPYKQDKGRKALGRVKCYIGVPEEFKGKQIETIEKANISNAKSIRYVVVGEICKLIGAK